MENRSAEHGHAELRPDDGRQTPPNADVVSLNHGDLPLAISVKRACELTSPGKTSVTALIRQGQLEVTRVGGRTLVHTSSVLARLGMGQAR